MTADDWKVVEGKRDQLVGKIQERYGIGRKKQNVRYPSSRETTELEHLGPGAEPEPLAVVLHDGPGRPISGSGASHTKPQATAIKA